MAEYGFKWEEDSLTPQILGIDNATDRFLRATMAYHAPLVEAHAKRNARWTDRTSNARSGLFATHESARPVYRIILGHSVPYGIWLEVRWSGRYAIIEPTIREQGKEVMKTIRQGYMRGLAGV